MEVHIAKGAWWSISVPIVWINRRKLRTCGVYDCDQCDEKTKTLESMKKTYSWVTWKIFRLQRTYACKTFHRRLFWNQEEAILLQRCLEKGSW